MGNRRNPNEIPQKMLTKHKQATQKNEMYRQKSQKVVDCFWMNLINK